MTTTVSLYKTRENVSIYCVFPVISVTLSNILIELLVRLTALDDLVVVWLYVTLIMFVFILHFCSIFFRISVLGVSWTSWGYKISGRHDSRHNTRIMHLGEHLQETCAIEVNRDITDKI